MSEPFLPPPTGPKKHRLGCVSFLNSKPLIEPIVELVEGGRSDVEVLFAVPSQLVGMVDRGEVSTGLLSVVDYQECGHELVLVPVGAIGCDGPTLTVRIYSKVPPQEIGEVYGDTDSHTSVILAQVILRERYGVAPPLFPLQAMEGEHQRSRGGHETILLIGDKVVNAAPEEGAYPYQLDLGEEWKKLTGLPFVFACWMMRTDMVDKELAELLAWSQREGAKMTERLLDKYAAAKGWPRDLARRYFTQYLRYQVTVQGRRGMEKFFELAGKHGLLRVHRTVNYLEVGHKS